MATGSVPVSDTNPAHCTPDHDCDHHDADHGPDRGHRSAASWSAR